jgi:biotin carboxylase
MGTDLPEEGPGSPLSGKRVLLLMSSRTYRAGAFLRAAADLGVSVLVGSDVEAPLGGEGSLRLNFGDPEGAAAAAQAFASDVPIDAVIAAEDEGTWLASDIGGRLGLAHNSPRAVAAVRDKAAMRDALAAAGVSAPQGMRIDIDTDPEDVADRIAYPSVIKPRFLSGSQGVIRVNTPGEFVFAFQRVRRLVQQPEVRALGGDVVGSLWCETYVPGDEVALEGMLTNGALQVLALFDKPDPLEGPTFEETIYVTPSRHSQLVQDQVTAVAQAAVSALDLETGPVHIEVRIHPDGVSVIDLAARSIGGLCAKALRFENGESLEALILRQALGDDVRERRREAQASGVMMIPIPHGGRLRAIGGIGAAQAVPGVEEVIISVPVGEELVPLPEGGRYLGFIFGRSPEAAQVETALRRAHAALAFEIVPSR